jgi:hypothetical protein
VDVALVGPNVIVAVVVVLMIAVSCLLVSFSKRMQSSALRRVSSYTMTPGQDSVVPAELVQWWRGRLIACSAGLVMGTLTILAYAWAYGLNRNGSYADLVVLGSVVGASTCMAISASGRLLWGRSATNEHAKGGALISEPSTRHALISCRAALITLALLVLILSVATMRSPSFDGVPGQLASVWVLALLSCIAYAMYELAVRAYSPTVGGGSFGKSEGDSKAISVILKDAANMVFAQSLASCILVVPQALIALNFPLFPPASVRSLLWLSFVVAVLMMTVGVIGRPRFLASLSVRSNNVVRQP